MMDSRMRSFMASLHEARSFEQAAGVLLDMLPQAIGPAPLLRGMVHLRPDDSYKGFFARAYGAYGAGDSAGVDPTPSITAWRWLEIQRRPVLLDVAAGTVTNIDGEVMGCEQWPQAAGSFRSRERVLERRTSHILAFSLRRPGGRLDGFVSLELGMTGDGAPGTPNAPELSELWPERASELEILVAMAAPFLTALPRTPGRDIKGDTWLPVVGRSMQGVMADLEAFVPLDAILLLQGETGVGKTRLARWCHERSPRARARFESVNLVSESLREDLLFGHTKGAFTDAREGREGLVTMVHGGTLFIDEIDKLSRDGQATLLSLLDDGSYRVIGEGKAVQADVRFIVGTNIDLKKAVADGAFREDLYYRIYALPVCLPPLRERRDEIARWAQHFIDQLHDKYSKQGGAATLQAAAGSLLEGQPWPGNLRQLDSVMTRAFAFARVEANGGDVDVRLAHVERALAQEHGASSGAQPGTALWRALDQAAHAFVDMAASRPEGLSVGHARALSDLILQYGIDRLGDKKAYVALGKGNYLKSGNRSKLSMDKHITALEGEIGPMNDKS